MVLPDEQEMLNKHQHFINLKSSKTELHKQSFYFIQINITKSVVLHGTFKYYFNCQIRIVSEDVEPHSCQIGRPW